MGLVVEQSAECSKPTVVCDVCRQRIVDAADGNYEWVTAPEGSVSPIYFTHKRCSRLFEERMRRQQPQVRIGNMELAYLLVYLGNNLELDWDRAREGATWR